MNRPRLITIISILITLILLAIALPTIDFKIADQYKRIRGIDPKDFNANSVQQEFALQPATDLQGGSVTTLSVSLSSLPKGQREGQLNLIRNIIHDRLILSGFGYYDIASQYNNNTEEYQIVIKAPEDIDESLLNILISRGEVGVWVKDPAPATPTPTPGEQNDPFAGRVKTGITNDDFAGVTVVSDSRIYFRDASKPNNFGLKVTFKEESQPKLVAALYVSPNSATPILFAVDNTPVAIQALGQLFSSSNVGNELLLFTIVPDTRFSNSVLGAVMSTPVINFPVSIVRRATLPATLGADTLPTLKFGLLISFLLVQAVIVYYYRKRATFPILANVIFLIWGVALMKIFSTTLSLASLLGFLLGMALVMSIFILIAYRIRTAYQGNITKDELSMLYNDTFKDYRNVVIAVLLILIFVQFTGFLVASLFATGLGFAIVSGLLVMLLPVRGLLPVIYIRK